MEKKKNPISYTGKEKRLGTKSKYLLIHLHMVKRFKRIHWFLFHCYMQAKEQGEEEKKKPFPIHGVEIHFIPFALEGEIVSSPNIKPK